MSDLRYPADPLGRVPIRDSPTLALLRDTARDHHIAMRRRHDLANRWVWDLGEVTMPGIYGTIELTDAGHLLSFDCFGLHLTDLSEVDLPTLFMRQIEHYRKSPIRMVPLDKLLISTAPTPTAKLDVPQKDSHTEEFEAIIHTDEQGARTVSRHAWVWFWLLATLTLTLVIDSVIAFAYGYWAVGLLVVVCALITGSFTLAVISYYEDEKDEDDDARDDDVNKFA